MADISRRAFLAGVSASALVIGAGLTVLGPEEATKAAVERMSLSEIVQKTVAARRPKMLSAVARPNALYARMMNPEGSHG